MNYMHIIHQNSFSDDYFLNMAHLAEKLDDDSWDVFFTLLFRA